MERAQPRSQALSPFPPLSSRIETLVGPGHVSTKNLGDKKYFKGRRGGEGGYLIVSGKDLPSHGEKSKAFVYYLRDCVSVLLPLEEFFFARCLNKKHRKSFLKEGYAGSVRRSVTYFIVITCSVKETPFSSPWPKL